MTTPPIGNWVHRVFYCSISLEGNLLKVKDLRIVKESGKK